MTMPLPPAPAALANAAPLLLSGHRSSLPTRIADWIAVAANYYIAAAVYEQLCKLSRRRTARGAGFRAPPSPGTFARRVTAPTSEFALV